MDKEGKTFRVRGIPLGWDDERLESYLQEMFSSSVPTARSVALETHRRSLTGTVIFQKTPAVLQRLNPGKTFNLFLPKEGTARPVYLSLDVDFLGMTTLFTPVGEDHRVE